MNQSLLSFRSSLYILDINPLSYIWFINIFPSQPFHSIDILVLVFININLSTVFLLPMSLVSYPSSCPFILNSETSFRASCKAGLMIINSLSYCLMGFPGGSDSKESACNARDLVWSFGWEDPLEEGMATHSSILAWRIPMDRRAWWATVHGDPKSQTPLSD